MKLEEFIAENRAAFDHAEPRRENWDKLRRQLPRREGARILPMARLLAAAVALMAVTTVIAVFIKGPSVSKSPASQAVAGPEQIDPFYAGQIRYFIRQVDERQAVVDQAINRNPELFSDFKKINQELDTYYSAMQQELRDNPGQKVLLEEMIHNLKMQEELLDRQLEIIRQINKSKKKDNANNDKHA